MRLGKIVHYRSYGTPGGEFEPACRAALVTSNSPVDGIVSLTVFNPMGIFLNEFVDHKVAPGGWHFEEECPETEDELYK